MDKFDKFIRVLEESLETYRSSDPSIALQKAIDATKGDDTDVCFGPPPDPIELFVGAECQLRRGDIVVIDSGAGSTTYPFLGHSSSGGCESFMKNGKYRNTPGADPMDIVRVLNNPEPPQGPLELFVGAECVTRGGSRVTIVANDGVDCNKEFKLYPYKTIGENGVPKSYCANGKYITGDSSPLAIDIIRILNPEDRPSPVKYREVNQFDIDKEVETLYEGKWIRSKLVAFFKSPPPGADPDELIETCSLEGPLPIDIYTAEWWLSGPDEVRIIAKDNDPVVKTMWINVYDNGNGCIHPSAAMANLNGGKARRACVKVQYIDGQYDA